MIYQEHKTRTQNDEVRYTCEDVFGIIEIYAKQNLDVKVLDTLVDHILKVSLPQGTIEIIYGESKQTVRYTFKAVEQWGESEEAQ